MSEALLRARTYAGELVHWAPTVASRELTRRARAHLEAAFGTPLARAHEGHDARSFFARLTHARRTWAEAAEDEGLPELVAALLVELGLSLEEHAVDAPRLRGIAPGAHHDPVTRDAYSLHRDTWFANPAAQINVWMPLHDVPPAQGIRFFPAAFARPVENDSGAFDYDRFRAGVGFQNPRPPADAVYPRALEAPPGKPLYVGGERGAGLLFSATHLHGPVPHDGPGARFSLDFRVVHRGDHARGQGATAVDVACRGCACVDYRFVGPAPLRCSRDGGASR